MHKVTARGKFLQLWECYSINKTGKLAHVSNIISELAEEKKSDFIRVVSYWLRKCDIGKNSKVRKSQKNLLY